MSISSEISRIKTNVANAYTALSAKGATMPSARNTANLKSTIESIESVLAEAMSIETIRAICVVLSDFEKNYTELEYIQSSGTQFVNTNLAVASGLDITFDFQCTTVASGTQFLFYGSDGWKNKGFGLYLSSSSAGAFCYGSEVGTGVSVAGAQRHTYKQNQNSLYIDGNLVKQLSAQTFSGSAPIILFAGSEGSSVGVSPVKGKLYSCQIRNNGTLVRDFVPCRRNSDNAIGLYDHVNEKFYGNAGSGSFTGA